MLEALDLVSEEVRRPLDLYLAAEHKGLQSRVIQMAETLRDAVPGLRLMTHCSGLKNVNNKARQTGAPWIVLLSEVEGEVQLRIWEDDQPLDGLALDGLIARLQARFLR